MTWSPDPRIEWTRSAYSGGTVWDSHPLPTLIGNVEIDTRVYRTPVARTTGHRSK